MKLIYVMMMIIMVGCTGVDSKPVCPTVKVVKVDIPVNRRGGLDRDNRIVAFSLLHYYSYENNRVNKLVTEMNKKK